MGVGELRVEPDGLLVASDRPVQIVLVSQGIPQVVVGRRVIWVEPERLRPARDGLVQFFLVPQGVAQIVENGDVLRSNRTCCTVRPDGVCAVVSAVRRATEREHQ